MKNTVIDSHVVEVFLVCSCEAQKSSNTSSLPEFYSIKILVVSVVLH